MKTQKIIPMKAITKSLIVLTTIVVSFSFAQQKIIAQKSKAPNMDIHTAAFMGNTGAIVQHVKAGTDLNQKDQYGSTPLSIAATFNKVDVALALINGGADINAQSSDGSTPLHTAAFFGRTEIVKALLAKGANKNVKNGYGSTPLQSVSGPFKDVKPIYDQISKELGPLGFKLNYKQLEANRPKIATMLK